MFNCRALMILFAKEFSTRPAGVLAEMSDGPGPRRRRDQDFSSGVYPSGRGREARNVELPVRNRGLVAHNGISAARSTEPGAFARDLHHSNQCHSRPTSRSTISVELLAVSSSFSFLLEQAFWRHIRCHERVLRPPAAFIPQAVHIAGSAGSTRHACPDFHLAFPFMGIYCA